MNRILLIFLLCIAATSLLAQTQGQFEEAAEKALANEQYSVAYDFYSILIKMDSTRLDYWYNRGESAQEYTAYALAEESYLYVLSKANSAELQKYPDILLKLAQTNQAMGDYKDASNRYEQYLAQENLTDEQRTVAEEGQNDVIWSLDHLKYRDTVIVHYPSDDVNTDYTDQSFSKFGDTIYFTSYQIEFKRDSLVPKRNLTRIYRKIGEQPAQIVEELKPFTKEDEKFKHSAHSSFSKDQSEVYFTICEFVDQTINLRCDIYYRRKNAMGEWSDPVLLKINDPQANDTQPHLARNAETGETYLYFASDRAGGKGRLDIYRSIIQEDGTLSTPENLSDVNTKGDDITPFYYFPTNSLYFSSDGFDTYGGLDIHQSKWDGEKFSTPINRGRGINSSYNESGLYIHDVSDTGYFNSNRRDEEAKYWEGEEDYCCDDIYYVDVSIKLRVLTYDCCNEEEYKDRIELPAVSVSLYEVDENGAETLIEERVNPSGNDYDFILRPGRHYRVKGTKDGYTSDLTEVNLKDPELADKSFIQKDLCLCPGILLNVYTFKELDKSDLNGATITLNQIESDGSRTLIDESTKNSSNFYEYPLEFGNSYEILGTRQGFGSPDVETVDLTGPRPKESPIRRDLFFPQLLIVNVFDSETELPLSAARVQLLLSADRGGDLLEDRTEVCANRFEFGVGLGENYAIDVSRFGYQTVSGALPVFTEADIDDNGEIVFDVFLEKQPIRLYYDNDYPNPRTLDTITNREYKETNVAYLGRKDDFIQTFTKPLSKNDSFVFARQYETFFDQEVEGGMTALDGFAKDFLRTLQQNKSCEDKKRYQVTMDGYASPIAKGPYNENLTKRRIDCVRNYFEEYNNGAFREFINRGELSFISNPYGEKRVPKGVSDAADNRRVSVFGLEASAERRVEITITELQANN